MSVSIRLKHSSVAGKAPLPGDLVDGELGLNIEASDPAIYLKDSAGTIRRVGGSSGVLKAGDTMTGNLTVPSLNAGQLAGMRNVLVNGKVSINQRGVTYAAAAVGDYWADRWKKTAGGMTQIVEDGNYQPSTEYTLSGTGVTTQQITSPASGNWTIPDVPSTATNIQLEPGPVATPFEQRPVGTELALCQRYYQDLGVAVVQYVNASGSDTRIFMCPRQTVAMRPGVSLTAPGGVTLTSDTDSIANQRVYNTKAAQTTGEGIVILSTNRSPS